MELYVNTETSKVSKVSMPDADWEVVDKVTPKELNELVDGVATGLDQYHSEYALMDIEQANSHDFGAFDWSNVYHDGKRVLFLI